MVIMFRIMALFHKPTDPTAFARYERETHMPLVRQLPGIKRYTLSRGIAATGGA